MRHDGTAKVASQIFSLLQVYNSTMVAGGMLTDAGTTVQKVYQQLGARLSGVDVTYDRDTDTYQFVKGCSHSQVEELYYRVSNDRYRVHTVCLRCNLQVSDVTRMGGETARSKRITKDGFLPTLHEVISPNEGPEHTLGEGFDAGAGVGGAGGSTESDDGSGQQGTKGTSGSAPTARQGSVQGQASGSAGRAVSGGSAQSGGESQQGKGQGAQSQGSGEGQAGEAEGQQGEGKQDQQDEHQCKGDCSQDGDGKKCDKCTQQAREEAQEKAVRDLVEALERKAEAQQKRAEEQAKAEQEQQDSEGLGGESDEQSEAQQEEPAEEPTDDWVVAFKRHWTKSLRPEHKAPVYKRLSLFGKVAR